ncbi:MULTISPECIES: DUF393 domain-containing protein [unclassified Neptuniibacter]|uniref:thiol-disulfide oxidoreductase DCC family protein n=1 Tax=unclassified Neptuniibacter TaxID=2630693 RepID=UPI0025E31390|nr:MULTISPECIES: DUF393 domain-containing protein [unclassified Neptuniibacter]|tara:strand:+ start:2892 stop:3293 length:402 start_codon:yes stop_codon:yes gene_type:complete
MQNTPPMIKKPIVFFDGGCPMCEKEINHYKKVDRLGKIEWIDITTSPEKLKEYDISLTSALERLHCINTMGEKASGVASFVLLWDNLPYYRKLAALVKLLRLDSLLEIVYSRFAVWRFKHRCKTGQCSPIGRD